MSPAPAPKSHAAALLDLIDLAHGGEAAVARLRSASRSSLDALVAALSPRGDRSTRRAVLALLGELGVATDRVDATTATELADQLALAVQIRAVVQARTVPPRSRLVVTATGSAALQDLQQSLGFIPLFQLVEDVVRSATRTCWLGAPYWNEAALDQLGPALQGFARRGGQTDFVCQAAGYDGMADPLPVLHRAASDIAGNGGDARVWAFDARAENGTPLLIHAKFALADRHVGYLGSANMTRQGFGDHFEIGARLPHTETDHLVTLLEQLQQHGLLTRRHPMGP